jgi:hypothetical protein
MIYINGQLVDFSETSTSYKHNMVADGYRSTIKSLRDKHGDYVIFVTGREPRRDNNGRARPHKPYSVPYKINYVDKETGEQKWVYSPSSATVKDGVAEPSEGSLIVMNGSMTISLNEQPDLVFFLTMHPMVQRGIISIFDPEEVEDHKAAARALSAKFEGYIYGEHSPLNETATLHKIARKWGISNVDNMSKAAIKNVLYDKVQQEDDAHKKGNAPYGMEDFISDFNFGETVEIGADVQELIDKGLLSFSRENREWLLIIEAKQMPWSIMMSDSTDPSVSRTELIDYLIRNKFDADKLKNVLKGNAKIEYGKIAEGKPTNTYLQANEVNIDNLSEVKWAALQKFAGRCGLGDEIKRKKRIEVEGIVKEYLEANMVSED